jgi:hypothetical protein
MGRARSRFPETLRHHLGFRPIIRFMACLAWEGFSCSAFLMRSVVPRSQARCKERRAAESQNARDCVLPAPGPRERRGRRDYG